ncbi:MAG: FAD-binding oxidoreductase [Deltaproteobacteria bacterium]|nr:FAD-binding oxidoreductase [Deltaproteobacteria bacterium]
MKGSIESLAAKLERELDTGSVRCEPDDLRPFRVDATDPSLLCLPSNPDQLSAALRILSEAGASVIPWGGGTSMGMGNLPRGLDVVIGLERMGRLIEHDDSNLTATVQAGMKLATLQGLLAPANQFLALDPPLPSRATIGGLVAANTNGPRRMMYGGVRDQVVGMKMILASGVSIKAGGKVVKNVAGYDMCKLFIGSLGTLGIITEVTFRMVPIPECAATALAKGTTTLCLKLAHELFKSTLLPVAITILNTGALETTGLPASMGAVAVWTEGFEENVGRHLRDIRTMAEAIGLSVEILRDDPHHRLWGKICDFGAGDGIVLYRATVPLSAVAKVLSTIESWTPSPATLAHYGSGTAWVAMTADPSSVQWFSKLTSVAQEHGGHVVMAAATPALKIGVDVWGPPPPSLDIMRGIKRRFDPYDLLNPGRFVAGL